MAHSNSDMNIEEAVSDIRPYQFEPLLGTASVVFNEESSDSNSDIDLDQHSQNQDRLINTTWWSVSQQKNASVVKLFRQ